MDEATRKVVLVEYRNRKRDEILRGYIDDYPPYFWRRKMLVLVGYDVAIMSRA
jgi:hypothetical protein